jgi:hypothetical protein
VNIIDENIADAQRLLLRQRRIVVRHIGHDVGRKSMSDQEIVTFLRQQRRPTFVTHDVDFYRRHLCHMRYCLVWLDIEGSEVANYIRRLLRHPEFNTQTKRMGAVIRVSPTGLAVWRRHAVREVRLAWQD